MTDLKHRLKALRGQTGFSTAVPASNPVPPEVKPSLTDRLNRLGGRAAPSVPRRDKPTDAEVAALLGGECVDKGLIFVERRFPLDFRHGEVPLSELAERSSSLFVPGVNPEGMVFMDTETTGLAGGTGTLPFLLGLSRVERDALRVRQYFLTGFGGELALLAAAADFLKDGDCIVSFNGKCFDVPLIATRCRLAGRRDPFADRAHLDLLHPVRRAFQRLWPDCRLQTAERQLLAFERKDDLPGAEVPETWFRFVRGGVTERLPGILEHNRWDLVSLAALVSRVERVYRSPGGAGADVGAVARWHLERGDEAQAARHLSDCRDSLDVQSLLVLGRLLRRRGDWEAAVRIWESLAAQGCIEAVERLAKYHEHVRRDYRRGLRLAETLVEMAPGDPDHRRRHSRLAGKLGI